MIELLSTEQAAKALGVTAGTLMVWRSTKRYPLRFVKVGRKIRYREEDLVAFIESRTQSGVSDSVVSRARRGSAA